MEVHHHPQVERKKFREYIFEFIMIFLAVSLGFFAESYREYLGDHKKEKEYMKLLAADLLSDSAYLKACSDNISVQSRGLDTLIRLLRQPVSPKENLAHVYVEYMNYGQVLFPVNFSNGTMTELKNSGVLRIVRNKRIAAFLNVYEALKDDEKSNLDQITDLVNKIEHEQANSMFDFTSGARIFDMGKIGGMIVNTDSLLQIAKGDSLVLLDHDPLLIARFRNNIKSLQLVSGSYGYILQLISTVNQQFRKALQEEK